MMPESTTYTVAPSPVPLLIGVPYLQGEGGQGSGGSGHCRWEKGGQGTPCCELKSLDAGTLIMHCLWCESGLLTFTQPCCDTVPAALLSPPHAAPHQALDALTLPQHKQSSLPRQQPATMSHNSTRRAPPPCHSKIMCWSPTTAANSTAAAVPTQCTIGVHFAPCLDTHV